MLSGRYPSDEFAELRPRITWDRVRDTLTGREGAKRVAIANAGTIPDRGLYGVFLAGADRPVRVGELDEEMVFETQVGETFTLGASTWRIEEITHDRVLVTPAPGEPGKMPFWHGDQAGRPVELGYAIGKLVRELRALPRAAAIDRLVRQHDLDSAGRREHAALPRRSGGRRRRAGRPHDRHRTLPRRARRLARVPALAARQPHPCAVGDGRDRPHPQADRHGRRGDVGRRRLRRPLPGSRDAARSRAAAPAGSDDGRSAGAAAARIDVALCRAVPRAGRARPAAAPPPPGRADAALAAAEAGV